MKQCDNEEKDPLIAALEEATTLQEVSTAVSAYTKEKLTTKEAFILNKKMETETKRRASEESIERREAAGLPPLEKIDYQFGEAAYGHKLRDCEASPRMSLELAALDLGKDMIWVDSMKHTKWPHNKQIAVNFKDQLDTFDHNDLVTNCIAEASTLNRGLTVLHKFQEIDRSLKKMREEIDNMKLSQRLMMIEQAKDRLDIDVLLSETGVEPLSDKEKAKVLKAKGIKNIVIAERLGVHINTITRWLRDGGD